MAVTYRENRPGIEAMLRTPSMVAALTRLAEPVRARATALTPVKTGRMKASWVVTGGVARGRAYALIRNTARSKTGANYPLYLEHGTRHIKRMRILGRALQSTINSG